MDRSIAETLDAAAERVAQGHVICDRALAGDAAAIAECARVIAGATAMEDDDDTDEMEDDTKTCSCSCDCGEDATTTDDGGNAVCEECSEYFVDGEGDAICALIADGNTCHVCHDRIAQAPWCWQWSR